MNTEETEVRLDSNKIVILEKKLQKVKSINDEMAKHLFDTLNRGRRLAQSLGFNDVYDAQFAIDSFDHDISFRECYDRLHRQDDELSTQKKEMATLQTKLYNAEERLQGLQAESEARTSESRPKSIEYSLREQLRRLNEKYDALKDVKERAAERYKADFKKWRAFNDWLFSEDTEHHKHRNEPGITHEEKMKRDMTSLMRKKQKMIEIGPDLARFEGEPEDSNQASTNLRCPPPLGRVEMDSDKENEGTPVPPHKKRRISPSAPLQSVVTNSSHMPNSSDTEDDSQAMYIPISGTPGVFKVPAPPQPSNPLKTGPMHNESIQLTPSNMVSLHGVTIHPSLSCRPAFALLSTKENIHMKAHLSLAKPGVTSATKDKIKSGKFQNGPATPAITRTSGQKCIEDYSAFKGRGRYGHAGNQLRDTTINAEYTIDPNQNGGMNYQYDSVVRNRDERRRLDAGDCECCHEYYQGIGPLPSRLQPPLWRSPPATPTRPCLHLSHSHSPKSQHPPGSRMQRERLAQTRDIHRQPEIESHKKAISRHRHTWARANTPPGYWDIGFPDTQAVGDINEKAEKMHERKKAEIDKEAGNEGGRYRRR